MPLLNKGLLIAIEGIDGSGKSTLAHNLFLHLHEKQYPVLLTKEPGGTPLGKKIRELVQNQTILLAQKTECLLFAADRAQHFAELVIPALEQNNIVISDRLCDSTIAYQGYGRKIEFEHLSYINHWTMDGITPDLTVFVRVPVEIALERVTQRGQLSAFEKKDFLENVAHGFEEIYKDRSNLITVDGTQSIESLTHQTCNAVIEWIQKIK